MESTQEVLFAPFPKQIQFLEAVFSNKFSVILYGGAIRGGKTFAGIGTLILLCKKYPKSRWAIVRDSLPTLKRNTIPSFFKCCPQSFVKSYNQDTQVVTFTNGSQILFFSENFDDDKEMNRWKGLEVNGFLLEEINELQEQSFYKAIERAGAHIITPKPPPIILATCNPHGGWVKDIFYDRYKKDTLPEKWLYIPSKIFDNPYVTSDTAYMEQLQQMPKFQYEKYVNGDWDLQLKTGGEFYKCFELDKHVIDNPNVGSYPKLYDANLPLHISWDDNVNPYLPVGIFQIKDKNITMIDEIAGITPNNTIKAVCLEFERRYPAHKAGLFVYGDATADKEDTKIEKGMSFYRLIQDALKAYRPTLRVLNSNPSVVMRGNWINTVLEKGTAGIIIRFGSNCKKTINDLVMVKEDAEGKKLKEMETDPKTKVRYQKVAHFSDLLDYVLVSAFANDYSNYQRGDIINKPAYARNTPSKNAY